MKDLDESSGLPLYYQLQNIIQDKIVSREWAPDTQIPTEEELVTGYKVSRSTVRTAILELTRKGLLRRKRGVGTFVTSPVESSQVNPLDIDDTHENLDIISTFATSRIADMLQIDRSEPIFEFVRLRHVGKEMARILEQSYVRQSLCPNLPSQPPLGKFYDWLGTKCGVYVHHWEATIEAILLSREESCLLKTTPEIPAIFYKRLNFDVKGVPIYFSKSFFRGDSFCMSASSAGRGWVLKNKNPQENTE